MWRKGIPCVLLVGMQVHAATVGSSMELPQKIKMELPYDPAIPLSCGNLSKETQNTNSKEYMNPYIHCIVIYNSQDMEAAEVAISK